MISLLEKTVSACSSLLSSNRSTVSSPLSSPDLIHWIRLSRSENVGPVSFRALLERYKTPAAALEALPEWARRGGRQQTLKICSVEAAEREIDDHYKGGADLITLQDPRYPVLLKTIHDAPPLLSIKGNSDLLNRPLLGIVGARNASFNGKKLTSSWAREISEKNIGIVSGLARGIDTAAHEGSLAAGTIAVVAGGVDYIYPPENQALYQAIAEKGLIIAESPFGVIPQASYFPRRNRLISGLSQILLIVEAAHRSGSLITARFALEQNREVCAVPGSPLDPRCFGTNQLIQQGAALIQSAAELLEMFQKIPSIIPTASPSSLLPLEEMTPQGFEILLQQARPLILENLSFSPIHIDELMRACHVSMAVMMTVLIELDLAGRLDRQPGFYLCLRGEY